LKLESAKQPKQVLKMEVAVLKKLQGEMKISSLCEVYIMFQFYQFVMVVIVWMMQIAFNYLLPCCVLLIAVFTEA